MVDYSSYIKSPEWRRKRQQKLNEVGHRCEDCHRTGKLQVHHINYDSLGNEILCDLKVLCDRCHKFIHDVKDEVNADRDDFEKWAQDRYGDIWRDIKQEELQKEYSLFKAIGPWW